MAGAGRARVDSHQHILLDGGWQAAGCAPGTREDPADLEGLDWLDARVPGTAAGALADAGRWRPGEPLDLDAQDWWFRTTFTADPAEPAERLVLCLDGLATVSQVYLNRQPLTCSHSMFVASEHDVGGLLQASNELSIRFQALRPLLAQRRRPRARWRTKLVDGNLRFFRTMLLGRAPGFAPGPAAVGPWRAIRLERRRHAVVEELGLRPLLRGSTGVLSAEVTLTELDSSVQSIELHLDGPSGSHVVSMALAREADRTQASAEMVIPEVEPWWPHTHGEPALHRVWLQATAGGSEATRVDLGTIGFRSLTAGPPGLEQDVLQDGLSLHVNGQAVFARGAVWTPADFVSLSPSSAVLREALEQMRDAGMNVVRVVGTAAYEAEHFYELCDELGLLVWQDFMFANLDYPIGDPDLREQIEAEVSQLLQRVGGRASLAVLCGNSEIEQQVAMLGLDPTLGRGELFGELLPAAIERHRIDAVYVPSAPSGGELPFRPDRGVAHYFGVGGYRRSLEDARQAEVRFAAECLAFANVGEEEGLSDLPDHAAGAPVHHPGWKLGVPRDAGAGWDFDDVRDHYLKLLYGLDPGELRRADPARYLELSRAVTGEAMAHVVGDWRRARSPCAGAIVLWWRDLAPGAGWGLVDHRGVPKGAYHHLRRAMAPVAVWLTDEGLGGIVAHLANDRADPLRVRLRISLYRHLEQLVDEGSEILEIGPREGVIRNVESVLGRFVDASWAYRFGPPGHDVVVASLEQAPTAAGAEEGGADLLSQAMAYPLGRPVTPVPVDQLGLECSCQATSEGLVVTVASRRLAHGVHLHAPGWRSDDNYFSVEPGHSRSVRLRARDGVLPADSVAVTALNLEGHIRVAAGKPQ
ncbi:MAG TPA: hypothetical protein VGN69_10990 [Solirubrobacteraceae bacterium]|nr:hypothetical protein [Solirubrobacteraceae bacterium]